MKKKIISLILSLALVLGAVLIGVMCASAQDEIPQIDESYSGEIEPITINEDITILLSNVTISTEGTTYGSPVKITGGATANIVLEGENTLTANSNSVSAGVEVESGSTVNIYAREGGSLTVTGGMNSAGIGGIGYGDASETNPAAGNIIIHSGKITAIGGSKGAAIGSGYHSSASEITIKGGDITALGTGGGAGIGSGYGTSGGAATAARVGFYNGGNITISGGRVRAASCHIDMDNFDVLNSDTYYGEGYSDSFAAGIGGGYGASSGNIIIEGDADVTAFGSCGGAGIGTGRGTSKAANFDNEHFDCNIIIRGNAKVAAAAGADRRSTVVGDDGGAGIGLGRACTLEGSPKGTISIEDNAQVTAVAEDHASAIGAGYAVGKYTKDADGNIIRPSKASVNSLDIGSGCTVIAVNDGTLGALEPADSLTNIISLNAGEEFKTQYPEVFAETEDSVIFKAYDRKTGKLLSPEIAVAIDTDISDQVVSCLIPDASDCVYFSNGEYCLGNETEERLTDFVRDGSGVKEYDLTCLCYTATFVTFDNTEVPVDYPVGAEEITEPAIPDRDYYTAVWEDYELNGNITVNAVYTPIEYKAAFTADGKTVGTVPYTVETKSIEAPAVPAKEGYTGAWEKYELTPGGITVKAVYTEIKTEEPAVEIKGDDNVAVNYQQNKTFSVNASAVPQGGKIVWYVDGKKVGEGKTFKVENPEKDYTIQAKIVDKSGKTVAESETVNVKVKSGLFDRIRAWLTDLILSVFAPLFDRFEDVC